MSELTAPTQDISSQRSQQPLKYLLSNMAAPPSTVLPERPKNATQPHSSASQPPPGQTLTGKQEHCEWQHTRDIPSIAHVIYLHQDLQTSSVSSYRSKSTMRYPSLLPPPLSNVSVLPSDRIMARSPPWIPTCPFYATSSFIMSEISPSSIRQEKKSSGRISFRWYVGKSWPAGRKSR